jgi:hypothetical protein
VRFESSSSANAVFSLCICVLAELLKDDDGECSTVEEADQQCSWRDVVFHCLREYLFETC